MCSVLWACSHSCCCTQTQHNNVMCMLNVAYMQIRVNPGSLRQLNRYICSVVTNKMLSIFLTHSPSWDVVRALKQSGGHAHATSCTDAVCIRSNHPHPQNAHHCGSLCIQTDAQTIQLVDAFADFVRSAQLSTPSCLRGSMTHAFIIYFLCVPGVRVLTIGKSCSCRRRRRRRPTSAVCVHHLMCTHTHLVTEPVCSIV